MKLIQPKPNYQSPFLVSDDQKVDVSAPVSILKYRFPHHAGPSGYSRICDYLNTPTIQLSNGFYWLGETLLRPYCLHASKRSGKFEYSRYDCIMEMQFLFNAVYRERRRIYHFIYCEKSFHLTEKYAKRLKDLGHILVGTVHHMPEQQHWLFRSQKHFRCFDYLITMDQKSISYWEGVTGKANVRWIPNGVDATFFRAAPFTNSEVVPPQKRIFFAGFHERDFETLEATISKLPEKEGFSFDLVGKSEQLRKIGTEYPHVRVHHRITDDEYRSLLQSCTLLLLPLHSSTFCNVVLESMACGLPIATTKGGIEAYLNSEFAIAAAPGDAEALALGVRDLCQRHRTASIAARKQAEHFSWREVAIKHAQFYESLTGVGGPSRASHSGSRHTEKRNDES
jgi:glycosyltransferase involved in cell wall biosynthesis